MADRLADDREKLEQAVGFFRVHANLHGGSSDVALVRWAHEQGKAKPHADMVRTAWHDFAHGRMAASLEVEPYRIKYHSDAQLGLFAEGEVEGTAPPPADDRGSGEGKGKVAAPDASGTAAGPDPFCAHKVRTNDGTDIICEDCGEFLQKVPPCDHLNTVLSHDDDERLACRDCGADLGLREPEKSMDKPAPAGQDDEEILY